jgi:hypothetical protein
MKKKMIFFCLFTWLSFLLLEGSSMANMFFSTSKYQEEIVVEPLLLNKDDVIHLLSGRIEEDFSHSHLFNNGVNLVVRLRNTGNKGKWGTLVCNVEGYGDVQIYVPHLTPNMKEFVNFVIPLSGMVTTRSTGKPPALEVKWEKLYSK